MSRAVCLVALVAGVLAAPGCNCLGGGCRRPSFMEFGSCLSPGCRSAATPMVYSAPAAPACGSECGGCDACGSSMGAPCGGEGMIAH